MNKPCLAALIETMSDFSRTTRDDILSVRVSRIVEKLETFGLDFSRRLSADDLKIITMFERRLADPV